jgi:regulator of protease activity HflC (stomatin/prohibitin superfamily)
MTIYARKSTIKQSLLNMIGQIQIDPHEVGIVLQNGRFGRFLQAGGHLPLNPIHERLVTRFPIKVRTIEEVACVPSADGFEFTANLTVQYCFNPSQAAKRHQADMAAIALNPRPDTALRKKVGKAAISELRRQTAQFSGAELRRGGIYEALEKRIHRHLHRGLAAYGISINMPNSVYLNTLTPPDDLLQTMQMIHRQKQIAQMLAEQPQAALAVQLDMLAQQDEAVHHTYGTWPSQSAPAAETVSEVQAIILPQSLVNGRPQRHAN